MIAQKDVDAKTNEITQVRPLLDDASITGALVTADALHVQRETARYLVEDKGADYLFTAVKENQPEKRGYFVNITVASARLGRLSLLALSCSPRLAGRTPPDRTDIDNKQNIDRLSERSVRSSLTENGGCD